MHREDRSAFLVTVPVMVLLLLVLVRYCCRLPQSTSGRPDLVSAALSVGTVLAVVSA